MVKKSRKYHWLKAFDSIALQQACINLDLKPLHARHWTCPACHVKHDRDINAEINIRQQGIIKLRAEGLSVPANEGLLKSGHVPVAAREVGSLAR